MAAMPQIKTNLPQPGETKAQFITRVLRILMKAGKSKTDAIEIATRIWNNFTQHSQVTPAQVDSNVSFRGNATTHATNGGSGGQITYDNHIKQFSQLSNKLDSIASQRHQVSSDLNSNLADTIQRSIVSGLSPLAKLIALNNGNSPNNNSFQQVIQTLPNLQSETNQILGQLLNISSSIHEELSTIRSVGMKIKHTNRGRRAPNRSDYWTQQNALPRMTSGFGRTVEAFAGQIPELAPFLKVARFLANPIGSVRTMVSNKVRGWSDKLRSMFDPNYQYAKDPDQLKQDAGVKFLKDDELLFKVQTETIPQALADLKDGDTQKIELLGNIYSVNRDQLKYISKGQIDHQYASTKKEKTIFNRDKGIYQTESEYKKYTQESINQQKAFLSARRQTLEDMPGFGFLRAGMNVLDRIQMNLHGTSNKVTNKDMNALIEGNARDREGTALRQEQILEKQARHVTSTSSDKFGSYKNAYIDEDGNVLGYFSNDKNGQIEANKEAQRQNKKQAIKTNYDQWMPDENKKHSSIFFGQENNLSKSIDELKQDLQNVLKPIVDEIQNNKDVNNTKILNFNPFSVLDKILPESVKNLKDSPAGIYDANSQLNSTLDDTNESKFNFNNVLSTSNLPGVLNNLKYEIFNKENEPVFVKVVNFADIPKYHSGGIITDTGSQVFPIFDAGGPVTKYVNRIHRKRSGYLSGSPNKDEINITAQKGEYVLTKGETKSILEVLTDIKHELGKTGSLYNLLSKITNITNTTKSNSKSTDVTTELTQEKLRREQEERDQVQKDILDYTKKIYDFLKENWDKIGLNKKPETKKSELPGLFDFLKGALPFLAGALGGGALAALSKKIGRFLAHPLQSLKKLFSELGEKIITKAAAIKEGLARFFTKTIPEVFESTKKATAEAFERLGSHLDDFGRTVKNKASLFKESISEFGSSLKNKFSEAFDNLPKFFDELRSSITSKLSNMFKSIGDFASSIWKSVQDLGSNVINKISDLGSSAKKFISESLSKAWESTKALGKTAWEGAKSGLKAAGSGIKTGVSGLAKGAGSLVKGTGKLGKAALKGLWRNKGNIALVGAELGGAYFLAKQNAEKNGTTVEEELDKIYDTFEGKGYLDGKVDAENFNHMSDDVDLSEIMTVDVREKHNGGRVTVPKFHTGGQTREFADKLLSGGQTRDFAAKLLSTTEFEPSKPGIIDSTKSEVPILAQKDEYILTKNETKSIIKVLNNLNNKFDKDGLIFKLVNDLNKSINYIYNRFKYKETHTDKDYDKYIMNPIKDANGLFNFLMNSVKSAFGIDTNSSRFTSSSNLNASSLGDIFNNSSSNVEISSGGTFSGGTTSPGRDFSATLPSNIPSSNNGTGAIQIGGVSHVLGSQFTKYESNTRGTREVSHSESDPGGTSFGKYQFSSKKGSLREFVDSLKTKNPQMYEKLNSQFGSATGGKNTAFADAWRSLADNPEFQQYEKEHAEKMFYHDALRVLAKKNPTLANRIRNNPALSDAFFSATINHGAGGGRQVFNRAYHEGISDEDLIRNIYQERINRTVGHAQQPGLHSRYRSEVNDILAYNNKFKSGALSQSNASVNMPNLNNMSSINPSSNSGTDSSSGSSSSSGGNSNYSQDQFIRPTKSNVITSPFGPRKQFRSDISKNHKGIDLRARTGDPIFAASSGEVTATGGNYGTVAILHPNGLSTVYMHLSKINVRKGQTVKTGDIIGLAGGTGPKGPTQYDAHLHFGVAKGTWTGPNSSWIDPEQFLKSHHIDLSHKGGQGNKENAPLSDVMVQTTGSDNSKSIPTETYNSTSQLTGGNVPGATNSSSNNNTSSNDNADDDPFFTKQFGKLQEVLKDKLPIFYNNQLSPSDYLKLRDGESSSNNNTSAASESSTYNFTPEDTQKFNSYISSKEKQEEFNKQFADKNLPDSAKTQAYNAWKLQQKQQWAKNNLTPDTSKSGTNLYSPYSKNNILYPNSKATLSQDQFGVNYTNPDQKFAQTAMSQYAFNPEELPDGLMSDKLGKPTLVRSSGILSPHDFEEATKQLNPGKKLDPIQLQRQWDKQFDKSYSHVSLKDVLFKSKKTKQQQMPQNTDIGKISNRLNQLSTEQEKLDSTTVSEDMASSSSNGGQRFQPAQTDNVLPKSAITANQTDSGSVQNGQTPMGTKRSNIADNQHANPRSVDYMTEKIVDKLFNNTFVALQQSANFYALGNNTMSAMHV